MTCVHLVSLSGQPLEWPLSLVKTHYVNILYGGLKSLKFGALSGPLSRKEEFYLSALLYQTKCPC